MTHGHDMAPGDTRHKLQHMAESQRSPWPARYSMPPDYGESGERTSILNDGGVTKAIHDVEGGYTTMLQNALHDSAGRDVDIRNCIADE